MELAAWSATGKITSQSSSGGVSLQCPFPEPGNYTVQFYVGNQSPINSSYSFTVPTVAALSTIPASQRSSGMIVLVTGTSQLYSLSFDLVTWILVGPYNAPGTAGTINPVATVVWNLGGNRVTRVMSVYDGASITGIGDVITVTVSDETISDPNNPQQQYPVTIMVAKGSRASTFQPPTYATYITGTNGDKFLGFSVVPNGSPGYVNVPIPQKAGVISVFITAHNAGEIITEADVTVMEKNALGTTLSEYDPRGLGWVPINPQAISLWLVNNASFGITFGVTWGIDG